MKGEYFKGNAFGTFVTNCDEFYNHFAYRSAFALPAFRNDTVDKMRQRLNEHKVKENKMVYLRGFQGVSMAPESAANLRERTKR